MPDDRLIHPACGHSEKVNRLTALERDVWLIYKLAADDFGVMRFSATPLQDVARWLEQQPARRILKALGQVAQAGLIALFEHQGQAYVFDPVWQTWQKITHPRATMQPLPSSERVDANTRWLFALHPKGGRLSSWRAPDVLPENTGSPPDALPENSGSPPEVLPQSSRLMGNGGVGVGVRGRGGSAVPAPRGLSPSSDEALTERAAAFLERYQALYHKHRNGAHYHHRPIDFQHALELCRTWTDDARLDKIAIVFLTTDHRFAEEGSRTVGQFAAMASWCDSRLQEAGIA